MSSKHLGMFELIHEDVLFFLEVEVDDAFKFSKLKADLSVYIFG
jgi:hypothetical protein